MNEQLRQRYLRQMGLTPWVAIEPLPGAAPSPLLEIEVAQPVAVLESSGQEKAAQESSAPAQNMPAQNTATVPQAVADMLQKKPEKRTATSNQLADSKAASRSEAESTSATATDTAPSLMFTLQAHRGETIHLWAEQQQPDAPGLNREEQQQLAALLKLFKGTAQHEPKRFFCAPTAGRPMTAEIARPMFDLFLRSLLGREAEVKMLLCVSEDTAQALFDAPRYQPVVRGKYTFLPVSSLTEMLSDPAAHKATSWKAMQDHGFV